MASSTMIRCSFSSPFSVCTALISIPWLSSPIILRGGQVDDGDEGLAHQLLGLVVHGDAREDLPVGARAVHNLWDMQAAGVGSTYTIALQTEKIPYGLTVVYEEPLSETDSAFMDARMREAGETMLALTGNLGVFSWTYEDADGETHSESITLEEVNASLPGLVELYNRIYGTDWEALPSVKDYAASPASLQQLMEILNMPH